jgi:hypothetical protein
MSKSLAPVTATTAALAALASISKWCHAEAEKLLETRKVLTASRRITSQGRRFQTPSGSHTDRVCDFPGPACLR